MATASNTNHDLTSSFIKFLKTYYRDEVGLLAQRYGDEQSSLEISFRDLYQYDHTLADDFLDQPEQMLEYFDEALADFDLPADVDLTGANVRVGDVPEEYSYYPVEVSPTDLSGEFLALTGEVAMVSDSYSRPTEAAFECQRCGNITFIPQNLEGFQEPYECAGCDRQGPFDINYNQTKFVDTETAIIQTPPEVASGTGTDIPVYLEDDLTSRVGMGDRVTVAGKLNIRPVDNGEDGRFEPYLDSNHLDVEDSDNEELDISPEKRERIRELARGEEGDPLELAADSLALTVHGYEHIKKMAILAMVGGSRVEYENDEPERGDFHMLIIGDPSTGKSKLVRRINEMAWRSVGVSGSGATVAGTTATAKQHDAMGNDWVLDPGAFVKANGGVVCIDELDDMPEDVRSAMLEPMANQSIHINKAGINTELATQTAVIAAGNPKHGRFDPREPVIEQFEFDKALISRFDLIYTVNDYPDPDDDAELAQYLLDVRDDGKHAMRDDLETPEGSETSDPPVDEEILRLWIGMAKQQPEPVFEDESVKEALRDRYVSLRGANGYGEDQPVPAASRKLQAQQRIAEAAAKFELSPVITERHADIATKAIGDSMRDIEMDSDDRYDTDIVETGTSKKDDDIRKFVCDIVRELQTEAAPDPVSREAIVTEALENNQMDVSTKNVDNALENLSRKGQVWESEEDHFKYTG